MMALDLKTWKAYFDSEGHLIDEYQLRKASFYQCISHDVRGGAWPFLLNLWERNSSLAQRESSVISLEHQYISLRNQWINAEADMFDEDMKQAIKTIDKDVRRTDRTHPFYAEDGCPGQRMLRRMLITLSVYDRELSYVQGMNELCSPILLTLQDESLAFWCFVKLLPHLRTRLLSLDISPQLSATADLIQYFDPDVYQHIETLTAGHWLFCFRWYLLLFKNEFKMDDILMLWDVMFSEHSTSHFEVFVGSAIILLHREQVLACSTSDQLLYFAQSVTAKLSVESVITFSRELCHKMCSTSDGLSDKLAVLVKQVDKVPPPLVGFVRRQQCFKSSYSGRLNMDDDLIKSLMDRPQNTPLFLTCSEPSVPIPTQNFLSRMEGVQPLGIGVTPPAPADLPPPTSAYGVLPYSDNDTGGDSSASMKHNEPLTSISNDLWDMRICIHTDDALS